MWKQCPTSSFRPTKNPSQPLGAGLGRPQAVVVLQPQMSSGGANLLPARPGDETMGSHWSIFTTALLFSGLREKQLMPIRIGYQGLY